MRPPVPQFANQINFMNMKRIALIGAVLCGLAVPATSARAQGTAFSYQGQLVSGGTPANGDYDFLFALYNDSLLGSQVGNTVTNTDVGVTNGLFLATMDFGRSPWTGQALWLQILVRPTGSGNFT